MLSNNISRHQKFHTEFNDYFTILSKVLFIPSICYENRWITSQVELGEIIRFNRQCIALVFALHKLRHSQPLKNQWGIS
jgi:hypothetical protein